MASKPSAVGADWLAMSETQVLTLGLGEQVCPSCQHTQLQGDNEVDLIKQISICREIRGFVSFSCSSIFLKLQELNVFET